MEVHVSDGEVRQFRAGSMVLHEDTTGKGHLSRVVGPTEAVAVVVQLPADWPGVEGTAGEAHSNAPTESRAPRLYLSVSKGYDALACLEGLSSMIDLPLR
jgi:hypothetical protein